MAERIFNYSDDFDSARNIDDVITLVNRVKYCGGEYKDAYSFVTKYCSWYFREIDVPIVDSRVKGMLYWINKVSPYTEDFTQTKIGDDYRYFVKVYNAFKKEYGFMGKENKEIDKYLWQYAKNFENKYNITIGF